MQELELLQQKLEHLLKRFVALQAEQTRLQQTVSKQTEIIADQKERIVQLEKEIQLKSVVISASGSDGQEKEKLKKHLDKVIREIEKNIEML